MSNKYGEKLEILQLFLWTLGYCGKNAEKILRKFQIYLTFGQGIWYNKFEQTPFMRLRNGWMAHAKERIIYPHKPNVFGDCIKCGDTVRFNHLGELFCPIPDDEEELRCADVESELTLTPL